MTLLRWYIEVNGFKAIWCVDLSYLLWEIIVHAKGGQQRRSQLENVLRPCFGILLECCSSTAFKKGFTINSDRYMLNHTKPNPVPFGLFLVPVPTSSSARRRPQQKNTPLNVRAIDHTWPACLLLWNRHLLAGLTWLCIKSLQATRVLCSQ